MELPEARQCVDEDSSLFGAVAVKSEVPGLEWSVMTTANGGHHAGEDEVKDWAVLAKPKVKPAKKTPAPPAPPEGEQPPTG